MSTASLVFTPAGLVHGLYTEAIDLRRLGVLQIERATTIEFDNERQAWRVRDPAGVPLFTAPTRQRCLEWESRHLESQEDNKHDESVLQPGGSVRDYRARHRVPRGTCRV
jgi:hypothetical protein